MASTLDDDHRSFRSSVRGSSTVGDPEWEPYVEAKKLPRELCRAFGERGLLRLEILEQYGGSSAGDFRCQGARRGAPQGLAKVSMSLGSCPGIHADIVVPYLVELTTEGQRGRWLPGFVGAILGAIAMIEPPGGSDVANLTSTAVRDGGDWVLSGSKTLSTSGYSADRVVVAARSSPEEKANGISLFAVAPAWTASRGTARWTRSVRTSRTPRSCSSRSSASLATT